MAAQRHRVGIIGYGLSAKVFQIPYIQANPRFEIRAIVQRFGDEARKDHPSVTIHRSAADLFADQEVDVVVVSTPPQTHYQFVSDALKAGKHVVVEKPFCPSSKECDELIAVAKHKNKLLTVFQNRRWDADFATLNSLLSANKLGRVVEFESHFDRYDPDVPARDAVDAPGTGVIFDLGAHLIDQILQLYGPPSRITAFQSHQRSGVKEDGPKDACTVLLQYSNGLLATVKASPLSADQKQLRFWVRGEKGSFQKHHLDSQEPQLVAGMSIADAEFGHEPASKAGILTTYENGKVVEMPLPNNTPPTYGKFYDLLAPALDGTGPPPVKPEDARNVIRLIELAIESSKTFASIAPTADDFIEP